METNKSAKATAWPLAERLMRAEGREEEADADIRRAAAEGEKLVCILSSADIIYHYIKRAITMDELYAKLIEIPDSYSEFVKGIISYAEKKPERLNKLLQYLNDTSNPTSSDVVKFVMEQPDFHE